jgi:glycosyltransferase involved in cell wall biosynthesis
MGEQTGSVGSDEHASSQAFVAPDSRFRVSVVIPARNEALNLTVVLPQIAPVYEVVLVDGSSVDDTIEVTRSLRPDAIIIRQEGRGKGDALQQGFSAASGDIIVMLDADGSADPAEIPRFVAALAEGADFAKGSRNLPGGGSSDITWLRSSGNRYLTWLVNSLFDTSYTDLCYGYNAFWRHCLPAIHVDCAGFEVETLMNIRIARAGLRVTEVPSFELERIHGESNLRPIRDGLRIKRTIVRERFGFRHAPSPAADHNPALAELDGSLAVVSSVVGLDL